MTFEEMISRLDEIISQLSGGKTTLEQSLSLYAEGTKLLHDCNAKLDDARVRIETLTPRQEEEK